MNPSSQTLGKYQIIREIARSNDIVYEAYDPLMNRRVALKELSVPAGATSQQREDRIKRFLREARAAGTLAHPNIMTVYEVGEIEGRYFIAMEYLDGHTLRNEIDTNGFIAVDKAFEIAREVLEGLDFAHKNGVIHRDIKPDNIQLLADGRIKLTDFGIARLTFEPNLTMDGQVFGTPSYMSPEQVVGREIDARSDLFSVGVVLYEMISGQKPFQGDSVVSISYAIMNKEPDQPSQASWAVWQFLKKALDKSPSLRFRNAVEMIKAMASAESASTPGGLSIPPQQQQQGPNNPFPPNATPYQPYNPYQPAPPVQYSSGPPPVTTPYNPYQQTAPASAPYNPYQQGANVNNPVPVYYPPPPSRPLLTSETKYFLGRLITTILIMGALIALVIVGVNSIGEAIQRSQLQKSDQQIIQQLNSLPNDMSIDQRIAKYENLVPNLKSKESSNEAKRNLAVLYQGKGKEYENRGELSQAEDLFSKAHDYDPSSPVYLANLGYLYDAYARRSSDIGQRLDCWTKSADFWRQAAELETNQESRHGYLNGWRLATNNLNNESRLSGQTSHITKSPSKPSSFVETSETTYDATEASRLLEQAYAIKDTDKSKAVEYLYRARSLAPPDSQVRSQIQELLRSLGR